MVKEIIIVKRIHLFGIIALVLVLVSACSSDPDTSDIYGWSRIGGTAFTQASASYLSLQVDAGTPYLAFRDSESNIHKASVMSWDAAASDWNFVGSQQFSSNPATNLFLQMYNGNPFVAYKTAVFENATPIAYGATVKKWSRQ